MFSRDNLIAGDSEDDDDDPSGRGALALARQEFGTDDHSNAMNASLMMGNLEGLHSTPAPFLFLGGGASRPFHAQHRLIEGNHTMMMPGARLHSCERK